MGGAGRARGASGSEPATTNQRMELQAVLEAVPPLDGVLDVVTDSTYVANCFRDKWCVGWQRRGWRNSKGKPVANRDLWEPLIEAFLAGRFGVPRWVKGHSGDVMNDLRRRPRRAGLPDGSGRLGALTVGPPWFRPGSGGS